MSRIGNTPVPLPEGVSLDKNGNFVQVKGPKGESSQYVDPSIKVNVEDGKVVLTRPTDQKRHKSMHGLYRSLINNMVKGVAEGYKKQLELEGVGYKATVQGQVLELNVGYSHNIYFEVPEEISVSAETKKGQNPTITLECHDKHLITQVAAKLKSLRPVEPYKGKGIRFVGEHFRRKAGKAASK